MKKIYLCTFLMTVAAASAYSMDNYYDVDGNIRNNVRTGTSQSAQALNVMPYGFDRPGTQYFGHRWTEDLGSYGGLFYEYYWNSYNDTTAADRASAPERSVPMAAPRPTTTQRQTQAPVIASLEEQVGTLITQVAENSTANRRSTLARKSVELAQHYLNGMVAGKGVSNAHNVLTSAKAHVSGNETLNNLLADVSTQYATKILADENARDAQKFARSIYILKGALNEESPHAAVRKTLLETYEAAIFDALGPSPLRIAFEVVKGYAKEAVRIAGLVGTDTFKRSLLEKLFKLGKKLGNNRQYAKAYHILKLPASNRPDKYGAIFGEAALEYANQERLHNPAGDTPGYRAAFERGIQILQEARPLSGLHEYRIGNRIRDYQTRLHELSRVRNSAPRPATTAPRPATTAGIPTNSIHVLGDNIRVNAYVTHQERGRLINQEINNAPTQAPQALQEQVTNANPQLHMDNFFRDPHKSTWHVDANENVVTSLEWEETVNELKNLVFNHLTPSMELWPHNTSERDDADQALQMNFTDAPEAQAKKRIVLFFKMAGNHTTRNDMLVVYRRLLAIHGATRVNDNGTVTDLTQQEKNALATPIYAQMDRGFEACADATLYYQDQTLLETAIQQVNQEVTEGRRTRDEAMDTLMSLGINTFKRKIIELDLHDGRGEALETALAHNLILNKAFDLGIHTSEMNYASYAHPKRFVHAARTLAEAFTEERVLHFFSQWIPWQQWVAEMFEDEYSNIDFDEHYQTNLNNLCKEKVRPYLERAGYFR